MPEHGWGWWWDADIKQVKTLIRLLLVKCWSFLFRPTGRLEACWAAADQRSIQHRHYGRSNYLFPRLRGQVGTEPPDETRRKLLHDCTTHASSHASTPVHSPGVLACSALFRRTNVGLSRSNRRASASPRGRGENWARPALEIRRYALRQAIQIRALPRRKRNVAVRRSHPTVARPRARVVSLSPRKLVARRCAYVRDSPSRRVALTPGRLPPRGGREVSSCSKGTRARETRPDQRWVSAGARSASTCRGCAGLVRDFHCWSICSVTCAFPCRGGRNIARGPVNVR